MHHSVNDCASVPTHYVSDSADYCVTGVNLGRTGDARHKIFCFISSQLSHMNINYSLPSFQSSSAGNLPEGLAFARPNAVGPGATRTSFMRSTGFDTEAGGGGDGTHGTHADTGGMDI